MLCSDLDVRKILESLLSLLRGSSRVIDGAIVRDGRARTNSTDRLTVVHQQERRGLSEFRGSPSAATGNKEEGNEESAEQQGVELGDVAGANGGGVVLILEKASDGTEDDEDFSGDAVLLGVERGDAELVHDAVRATETERDGTGEFDTDRGHDGVIVGHLVFVEQRVQQVGEHREEAEADNTECVESDELLGGAFERKVGNTQNIGVANTHR